MNKTWKWILIGLGIAIVAFVVALPLFGMHRLGFPMMSRIPGFDRGFQYIGIMPLMAFGVIRGLLGLGVLALAVIGVVLLVRNSKTKEVAPPLQGETDPVTKPARNCRHCGRELKTDWVACPYCGKKQ
jgi:hypothetical protein